MNFSNKLTRPQKTEEIFDAKSNWFIPSEALNVEGVPHFERVAMRRLTQKEQNTKDEIETQDIESCNVLQEIKAVNLGNYERVRFCQCKNPGMEILDINVCRICFCEQMGKNEQVLVAKEADESDDENLVENLRTIMESSDNLRKVVIDSYRAVKIWEPGNE